ncbi:MAG: carbonic anhydrase [Xanthomonadales bacterium]|nr:carbonic anhydrase [Gammaproteobacteria bacterium]NNE05886.1 carbonic anhydrase [Xanthomonadales bacterium]NNL95022.1 carbonic anhydrase [Xanthomonadales bacterium]
MKSASQALEALKAGNLRFFQGRPRERLRDRDSLRQELLEGQAPFATILGCSDSRVPAEMVFDQDLGDLFVIRVAGNVVARSQIGSVEFASEFFKTRLVVVLGHSLCGAVQATLERHQGGLQARSQNLDAIVNRISPVVTSLLDSDLARDPARLMQAAVRANIGASVQRLKQGSPFLESLVEAGELLITGAEYSLETGKVEFFDDQAL